jgi:hypothetical protein
MKQAKGFNRNIALNKRRPHRGIQRFQNHPQAITNLSVRLTLESAWLAKYKNRVGQNKVEA